MKKPANYVSKNNFIMVLERKSGKVEKQVDISANHNEYITELKKKLRSKYNSKQFKVIHI